MATDCTLSERKRSLALCLRAINNASDPVNQAARAKSERCALTLTVHHRNRIPEDNRPENLIALCNVCHLSYHNCGQSNVSPGQLSLFPDDDIDWNIMDGSKDLEIENIKGY